MIVKTATPVCRVKTTNLPKNCEDLKQWLDSEVRRMPEEYRDTAELHIEGRTAEIVYWTELSSDIFEWISEKDWAGVECWSFECFDCNWMNRLVSPETVEECEVEVYICEKCYLCNVAAHPHPDGVK